MWFKLIAGASHTDADAIVELANAYGAAGIDCIDIACDLTLVEAVANTLNTRSYSPLLMVSIPLDPDPHFQKISLAASDCILCGVCVPACPADALELVTTDQLTINQQLCYGCNRCIPVCPTDALQLTAFLPDNLAHVLTHPQVSAVEIHTRHADVTMLQALVTEHQSLLLDKRISFCFSPHHTLQSNWMACLAWMAKTRHPFDWMLQIDGEPMSGTLDPQASRPALNGARLVFDTWQQQTGSILPFMLTISGGINPSTAALLGDYPMVQGVAMGTIARQWMKQGPNPAVAAAELVGLFKNI